VNVCVAKPADVGCLLEEIAIEIVAETVASSCKDARCGDGALEGPSQAAVGEGGENLRMGADGIVGRLADGRRWTGRSACPRSSPWKSSWRGDGSYSGGVAAATRAVSLA
jgi:hypothetical protein